MSQYCREIPDYADVMKVADFIEDCTMGNFIDYDGHGYAVKDGMMSDIQIYPSNVIQTFPAEATHIAWFNR